MCLLIVIIDNFNIYYKVLNSKNRYYCFGLCVGSKQIGVFIFTLILIVGTTILFFIFEYVYIDIYWILKTF